MLDATLYSQVSESLGQAFEESRDRKFKGNSNQIRVRICGTENYVVVTTEYDLKIFRFSPQQIVVTPAGTALVVGVTARESGSPDLWFILDKTSKTLPGVVKFSGYRAGNFHDFIQLEP